MPLPSDCIMQVLALCDIVTLLTCARTCTTFRDAVANVLRLRVALLLKPFLGGRVRQFRGLLRLHGAIVSGSVALALFHWPIDWQSGDLDIYVGDSDYPTFLIDFERLFPVVLEADMTRRHPAAYTGIRRVRRYMTTTGRRIEVIQSRSPNAVAPLLYFWSSLVVNFITSSGAVCGFPLDTLSCIGLVTDGDPTVKAAAARKKYEERGITFLEVDSWRVGGERWIDGDRAFSIDPLLVLDFHTVWPSEQLRLPVARVGSDWVVNRVSFSGRRIRILRCAVPRHTLSSCSGPSDRSRYYNPYFRSAVLGDVNDPEYSAHHWDTASVA